MNYITGSTIKELREKRKLTQKQLAEMLQVSDKTISKWETNRGLPDISLIGQLAESLSVSVAELLLGEIMENTNKTGNMKKVQFYVCPVCGNIVQAMGQGAYNCCGVRLPATEVEEKDIHHQMIIETIDNEYYVHIDHEMKKDHYITFLAYVTSNYSELIKLYPEQNMEGRFAKRGHGFIYAFCMKHGLFRCNV